MSGFTFKQFHVEHERCAMKVGTDGILLGAYCDVQGVASALDIGCGSGLIALMLAQRSSSNCQISAVELDQPAAEQARHNVEQSPWPDKIKVQHMAIQDFANECQQKFDLIVSNPPYYHPGQVLKTSARAQARHYSSLSHQALLSCALSCLAEQGRLVLILPVQQAQSLLALALETGWYCKSRLEVRTKPQGQVQRWIIELQTEEVSMQVASLCIHNAKGEYSQDYQNLTRAFYLKM